MATMLYGTSRTMLILAQRNKIVSEWKLLETLFLLLTIIDDTKDFTDGL